MRTIQRFPKVVTLLCAVSLAFALTACGGDDDDDDDITCGAGTTLIDGVCVADGQVDAAPDPIDADTTPDAAGPQSTRSGFIAILDLEILGSDADPAKNWSGAANVISYDVVPVDKEPEFSSINPDDGTGCRITVYDHDFGEFSPDEVDEGTVTVTGDGLLLPMAPCVFNPFAKDYICPFSALTNLDAGDSFTPNGDGPGDPASSLTATVVLNDAAFDTTGGSPIVQNEAGMYINISGFSHSVAGDIYSNVYPIVAVLNATTVVVVFPAPAGTPASNEVDTTLPEGFMVLSGIGPTPLQRPFLDSSETITIVKAASDEVEAIDTTVTPGADGFVLDTANLDHPLLVTSLDDPLFFGCDSTADPDECGAGLAMAVFGSATTADVSGLAPFVMPSGQTSGNSAGFACLFLGVNSVEIEQGIMDVLAQLDPTRIEFQIVRVNLAQVGNADLTNGTNVAVGTGFIGHANRPGGGW